MLGVACGAALARRGRNVVLLERHSQPGQETTARNSQVVHAGLYYPVGSLKAQMCVEGRERLYARCVEHGIPHRRIGKLVVATCDDELQALEGVLERAEANGAGGMQWLAESEVRAREPRVRAVAALWSPNTGIVDAHALASSYQAEMETHDGTAIFNTQVVGLGRRGAGRGDSWLVETESVDGERFDLEVPCVINAAGLASDGVAALAGLDVDGLGWRIKLCKGDYFGLAASLGKLTHHLVYPVPAKAGLGIHVTVDLGGRYRLGPDAEYVDALTYHVDPSKAEKFAAAAARYLPEVRPEHLQPEMAGIRPKLQGPGEAVRDFVIEESSERGAPGLVNLIGIESPGLTAAGAIAERVAALLDERGVFA